MAVCIWRRIISAILRRVADRVSPLLGAKIEEVTGRKVVAESDHWDTKLFHKNFWNHGCERVRYMVDGEARTRVRRTAFNLNSSGGLLAHDRLRRTFARMGKDFRDYAPEKVAELDKIEDQAKLRQGCLPGDWEINTYADEVMEDALKAEGLEKYVDQGFEEFLAHEILRHESGFGMKMSAKDLAERKAAIAGEIRGSEEVGKILGAVDGEGIADAARRVAALAEKPPVERTVEREVVKEIVKEVVPQKLLDAAVALRTERDELKVQSDESEVVISQMKLVLKPDSGEALTAAAKRVIADAAEVGVEREKVQSLEKEIGPLRRLKELFVELSDYLIKSKLFGKLPNGLQKRLKEMAAIVGVKSEVSAPEMGQEM